MPRKRKRIPNRVFYTYTDFLRFVLEQSKRIERDEMCGEISGKLFFADGSWCALKYSEAWTSDNGTGWPSSTEISYYEPEKPDEVDLGRTVGISGQSD